MVRLLALLDKLDLEQVARTGDLVRARARARWRATSPSSQERARAGVMLGFDVARADWRDALRDRAFRRGLRAAARRRAHAALLSALRHRALRDRRGAGDPARGHRGPRRRATRLDRAGGPGDPGRRARDSARGARGASSSPRPTSHALKPADPGRGDRALRLRRASIRPTCCATGGGRCCSSRSRRSRPPWRTRARSGSRFATACPASVVAYALGSALENHDEEGVASDPHFGENNTFYLQAMATLPSVQNAVAVENHLLDAGARRAPAAGLRVPVDADRGARSPRRARRGCARRRVLQAVDNYLRSGIRFVYLQPASDRLAGTTSAEASEVVVRRRA